MAIPISSARRRHFLPPPEGVWVPVLNFMEQLTNLIISDQELDTIANALNKLMSGTSATSVMLLDKSGQVVSSQGTNTKRNATSLGALLAGAFSSSRHVAELLGEKDFRTIFQQGVHENIYTTMVEDQWLLVIVFDKPTHIGLVKVLSKRASEELGLTLERVRADTNRQKSSVLNIQFRSSVEDTIDLLFRD
jgi:predicted regulator of Ras-like GTPase activity (Roadblock/LC7/MglB family)